jgi:ubiquinone/menaquinone biosynthesis C-methylase UbiE
LTGSAAPHTWGTAPDFVGPRHELREQLLLELFLSARPGPDVLNIGAGQGSFTRLLEARGFRVVSADASAAAVEVLRGRVGGESVVADMTALQFADSEFDALVAGEVLEHIEDDVKALSEAARVLRSGGVAAISVPAHPAWFGESDRWAGHVRRYTRQTLSEAVAGAELTLETLRPWGFPVSALYHRAVYDKRAATLADDTRAHGLAKSVLRAALTIDRIFVGVERGCLGYLALARAA